MSHSPELTPAGSCRIFYLGGGEKERALRFTGLAVGLLVAITSVPAFASVLWRGDYETGDLSQWQEIESTNLSRFQVVTSPLRQGRYALQVTVKQGDVIYGGTRNEVLN